MLLAVSVVACHPSKHEDGDSTSGLSDFRDTVVSVELEHYHCIQHFRSTVLFHCAYCAAMNNCNLAVRSSSHWTFGPRCTRETPRT